MSNHALRDIFMEEVLKIADNMPSIVAIDCDVAKHTKLDQFFTVHPERSYELGICEQNAVSFAAGMAACGKVPIVSSFSAFLVTKAWEQIRHSVIYNDSNVKLFATHSGLSAGEDGATHQCFEDIALMLALPKIEVFAPAFPVECRFIAHFIMHSVKPCYIRVGRDDIVEDLQLPKDFQIGDPLLLMNPVCKIALISTGEITHEVIRAERILKAQGIEVKILHIGSLRPLNIELLNRQLDKIKVVFTVEEHTRHGGLYSMLLDLLVGKNIIVKPLCIPSVFGQTGTITELRHLFHISALDIANEVISYIHKGVWL